MLKDILMAIGMDGFKKGLNKFIVGVSIISY